MNEECKKNNSNLNSLQKCSQKNGMHSVVKSIEESLQIEFVNLTTFITMASLSFSLLQSFRFTPFICSLFSYFWINEKEENLFVFIHLPLVFWRIAHFERLEWLRCLKYLIHYFDPPSISKNPLDRRAS